MENVCPERIKTLKRISGSQLLKKMVPVKPHRRPFNKMMRFSKMDELPKIDYKKSSRSVPTMLEINKARNSRR